MTSSTPSGATPIRCMPVSTFTWTRWRPPSCSASATASLAPSSEPIVNVNPYASASRDRVGGNLGEQEYRRGDPALAQLDPLVDDRHREHVGAAHERGLRGEFRAVTVAVGLHHGAEEAARRRRPSARGRCARSPRPRSPPAPDDGRPQLPRGSSRTGDHEGRGGHRGVRQRDVERVDAALRGQFAAALVQQHGRRAARRALHLDRLPRRRAPPTLRDFMTASLAAKRAASRSGRAGRRAARRR